MREKTYRAELCLVQVASGSTAVCIDPLALPDLAALIPVLTNPAVVKVMHAARQDLEVMLPAVGLVQPVFDTQIAAALAGFPAQIGYAELARRLLAVELDKAHTRTDWARRPLSAEQQEYALDDVRHLGPLRARLLETLAAKRAGWAGSKRSSPRSPMPTRCASRRKTRGKRSRVCRDSTSSVSSWPRRSPPGASGAPWNAIVRAAGSSTT